MADNVEDSNVGAYERSGKGLVATREELDNKFATYNFKDDTPDVTQARMEEIERFEKLKAQHVEHRQSDGEKPKKEGLLQKLKGGSKKDEEEADAVPETTQEGGEGGQTRDISEIVKGMPTDEHGNIIILKHGGVGHPDEPHIIVK